MRNILLVDDEMNYRRSLMIQLELEGFKVTEVESATQAFSFLGRCHKKEDFPDLVISDVRMPEMGGGDFALKLKEKFPQLPVLIISAFDLPEKLSGYPFLRKPFKIQQMITTMKQI